MDSGRYMVDITLTNEGLNPMLPHVVGVIEVLDEATLLEIKKQMETDLNKEIPNEELKKALDNGIKLGIVEMRREFKVCKEFTTREIKRLKYVQEGLWMGNEPKGLPMTHQKRKDLFDFVKHHRSQRRKKLSLKQRKQRANIKNSYNLESKESDYMCNKCRRSIERMRLERSRSRHKISQEDVWDEEDSRSSESSNTESETLAATRKNANKRVESKATSKKEAKGKKASDEKNPGKSKLLVEKNPLETEPPYYDIFT